MSVSSKAEDEADKKHISGPAKKRYVGGAINRAKQEKAGKASVKAPKASAKKPAPKRVAKAPLPRMKSVMELWKQDPRKHTDEELYREWYSHANFPLVNRLRENRAGKLLKEMRRRSALSR